MKHKKNILILSASKGIGFSIAKHLANENHNVIISSSNKKNLVEAKNKIYKETNKVINYSVLNLFSRTIEFRIKKIIQLFNKRIDVLILNSTRSSGLKTIFFSFKI